MYDLPVFSFEQVPQKTSERRCAALTVILFTIEASVHVGQVRAVLERLLADDFNGIRQIDGGQASLVLKSGITNGILVR